MLCTKASDSWVYAANAHINKTFRTARFSKISHSLNKIREHIEEKNLIKSIINSTFGCILLLFLLLLHKKCHIMNFQELIQTVKKRRKVLNVNQEEVALLSGVGLRTLKHFESGKGNITLKNLQKILEVLGLELNLTIKDMTQ